ncbi:DUF397 domain-containing protein [Streptomyces stackebrandtii]|uniref:DUF397 domain-containing protein n=1 Tax=Streptomyces stackebrandtii TaxID=3051177 RepID=UPI0028DC9B1F|nr:DUF397 domain-containing protein [Streptomyces sp. DSM 40976]
MPHRVRGELGGDGGGQCVEVAAGAAAVHVRDSKDVTRPGLCVTPAAWAGFVGLAVSAE